MKLDRSIRHLLVDLDGTLLHNRNFTLSVDFLRQSLGVLHKQLGWRGAARALLDVQASFGKSSTSLTNDLRALEAIARRIGKPIDETRLFVRETLLTIFPKLERHFYPAQGAREFLNWAKDHYTLILATNPVWPPEVIEMRVRWAGIDPSIFKFMTHARVMHACKPELQYYEEILSLQKLKAEECLLVGNEFKNDLPATRAGIAVFIVGLHKELSSIRLSDGRAPAWQGDFNHLKALLESPTSEAPQSSSAAQGG